MFKRFLECLPPQFKLRANRTITCRGRCVVCLRPIQAYQKDIFFIEKLQQTIPLTVIEPHSSLNFYFLLVQTGNSQKEF